MTYSCDYHGIEHIHLEYGVRQLRQCFDGEFEPEAVGLKNEQDPLLCVIGALLRHIQNTQGNIPSHLSFPSREDLHKYVVLDSASRKNLELVQNLQGTVTRSLWNTLDDCYTTSGSRMLKRWICYPERSQYEASLRHDAVRELEYPIRHGFQHCSIAVTPNE